MKTALLLIDLQNDYYPGGKFPLWNTEVTTQNIQTAIAKAQAQEMLVVHIQHIADPAAGIAPFFNEGTEGAAIVSAIHDAAPDAPVIVKHYADSFYETELDIVTGARNRTTPYLRDDDSKLCDPYGHLESRRKISSCDFTRVYNDDQ